MVSEEPIDIILATHNHLGQTIACVEALYANTLIPFRLVVIDDSTDLTPQYFKQLQREKGNIKYIRPKEKLYHGNQIIQIGIDNSTSDPFVYLGNSIRVEPDWLVVAHELMRQNQDVGLIGFKLIYPTNMIEHAGILYEPGMAHHMNIGVGEPSHRYTHVRESDIVGWALVLVRRAAIPEGGLDYKTYHGFMGYDDIDNCLLMRKAGWKILYCGLGCAYHWALATREGKAFDGTDKYEENRQIFLNRWGGTEEAKSKKLDYLTPSTQGRK